MSSELGVKCESELGAAIESELGVRDCAGGVLYIFTVKIATSEAFLFRVDSETGDVIYKINLWTVLTNPGSVNDRVRRHIRVDASGSNIYINRGTNRTKIRTAIILDLADRVVWDTGAFSAELGGISFDGDPRVNTARINKDTGAFVFGGGSTRLSAVGFNNKTYSVQTNFIFQHDEDGNQDWLHQIPINFPETLQSVSGIEVTSTGDVWVAYTTRLLVGGGPNVEDRYRLRMLDGTDGTLVANQPFLSGETPDINGVSFGVEVTPGRGIASWIYDIDAGPVIRRIKLIDDQNSEISTTDITVEQIPRVWEPGTTGTYLWRNGLAGADLDKVFKTDNILTTDIWNVQLDTALETNGVFLGAKD